MKAYKKLFSLLVCAAFVISFASCSLKTDKKDANSGPSEEEINSQYDEYVKDENANALPEGYNPITDSFTAVDFQLTMTDDTIAFNIPENAFATVTSNAASYGFLNPSLPRDGFEGSFKTAKGISLANSVSEFLASYKLEWRNILCKKDESLYVAYEGSNDALKISFGFSSLDGQDFSPLSSEALLPILLNRGASAFSEADEVNVLGNNQTIAIIDVVPQEDGTMREFTITRFDKAEKTE